jgi:hypothetical protein
MRPVRLALPALLLALTAAFAATPEEDYIAARDADIARIKKLQAKNPDADIGKAELKALSELEKRLQGIIGGLAAPPYPAVGKIALDALSEDEVGFGALDGLRFAKGPEGPEAFVTTDRLAQKWIARPADWWTRKQKAPPPIDKALTDDDFYVYAIGVDAALTRLADVPVEKPAGATFAVALLGGWAQDIGPNPNQQLIVAVRREGKIYIASEKASKFKPLHACDAIFHEAEKKAEALMKKYEAGDAREKKLLEAATAEQEKGDRGQTACYRERVPKEAFFPELLKEAQAIADRFGAK